MKSLLNDLCPPIVKKTINSILGRDLHWIGDYQTWQEAQSKCRGYDPNIYLDRLIESVQLTKDDETKIERDSLVFERTTYPYPLLTNLLSVCTHFQAQNVFILDFGGSLGTLYFHTRKFLKSLPNLTWNILEQDKIIQAGKTHFENEELFFHSNLDQAKRNLKTNATKILILSGVLQYLEDPYSTLHWLLDEIDFDAVILDRTSFSKNGKHRIAIQKVPKQIYDTECPSHLISEKTLTHLFEAYKGGGVYYAR